MSHIVKSSLLEEIIIALRQQGLEIPSNVMYDLKSARTLMKIEKTDSISKGQTELKIDQYLRNVEAYVISEADKQLPPERVEKWITALDLASCDSCITIQKTKKEMRLIPGVPRDQKGIRVEPIQTLPIEKLEQMATDSKLSFRREKDGHLLVYGSEEKIKGFIKKISNPFGKTKDEKNL